MRFWGIKERFLLKRLLGTLDPNARASRVDIYANTFGHGLKSMSMLLVKRVLSRIRPEITTTTAH